MTQEDIGTSIPFCLEHKTQCSFIVEINVLNSDFTMSLSTCRALSDSMRENPMLVVFGKGGRGWRGRVIIMEDMGEGNRGGGEGITKFDTNVTPAAAESKQYLLLGETCLAACSRGWVQHCGMTLHSRSSLHICVPSSFICSGNQFNICATVGVRFGLLGPEHRFP